VSAPQTKADRLRANLKLHVKADRDDALIDEVVVAVADALREVGPIDRKDRPTTDHHPDARSVIAAGICEWDPDGFADFEGDDLARVALEALTDAGYVVVRKDDR
jgi:hypothetical protein